MAGQSFFLTLASSLLGICSATAAVAADSWECRVGLAEPTHSCHVAAAVPATALAEPSPDLTRLDLNLNWDFCGSASFAQPWQLAPPPAPDTPIEISADALEWLRDSNQSWLRGQVIAERGTQHLETALAHYDRLNGQIQVEGDVLFSQPGLRLLGQRGELNLLQNQGRLERVYYRLAGNHNARGSADWVFLENRERSHYGNLTYTTCPREKPVWEIRAGELDIDRNSGRARAWDATLHVGGVPILYTPYLSFPLDHRRQSGFLLPSVGNSSTLGLDLRTPYYLNLAPDLDATLNTRLMSRRGLMLGGEVRYLGAQDHGQFYGEILPKDQQDPHDGVRGAFNLRETVQFNPRWSAAVDFNLTSDARYLEDFGDDLRVTSIRHLERRGELAYHADNWWLLGRAQGFQTVDRSIAPRDRPYSRLPQLLFGAQINEGWGVFIPSVEAEEVYFDHAEKVHGHRVAFRPSVSLPLRRSYGYVIPRATLDYTGYWLIAPDPGQAQQATRMLPSLSLDSGLIFERHLGSLFPDVIQTLEPRLFYLYTPYRDQSNLPLFDSAEMDFSFLSLFRENRFTGRDRIGDANQLTLGLTSRALDATSGREWVRGSLGQVLYFADRRVQLDSTLEDHSGSALAGELAARLSQHWSGSTAVLWDPYRNHTQMRKHTLGLHYHGSGQDVLNLTYRLNESDQDAASAFEATDISFRWELGHSTEFVGRWLYSLRNDQTLEAFGGIEYGDCCWRVRALVRNFINGVDEHSNLSVMLQLELAGLGAFGNNIEQFLGRGIYGHELD